MDLFFVGGVCFCLFSFLSHMSKKKSNSCRNVLCESWVWSALLFHYFKFIIYIYIFLEVLVSMNQSNAFGTNKKLLMLSSDQMNRTSWGCEGVFLWCYDYVFMFVMWQEVVTCGGGGCCQMMAPGGAMCKLKVGGGGGGRNEERSIGEEERSLYTTNRHPFPLQLAMHTSSNCWWYRPRRSC